MSIDQILLHVIYIYYRSYSYKKTKIFRLYCDDSVHPLKPSENQFILIDVLWFLLSDVEQWLLEEILHKCLPLFLFGLDLQHTFEKKYFSTYHCFIRGETHLLVIVVLNIILVNCICILKKLKAQIFFMH